MDREAGRYCDYHKVHQDKYAILMTDFTIILTRVRLTDKIANMGARIYYSGNAHTQKHFVSSAEIASSPPDRCTQLLALHTYACMLHSKNVCALQLQVQTTRFAYTYMHTKQKCVPLIYCGAPHQTIAKAYTNSSIVPQPNRLYV